MKAVARMLVWSTTQRPCRVGGSEVVGGDAEWIDDSCALFPLLTDASERHFSMASVEERITVVRLVKGTG